MKTVLILGATSDLAKALARLYAGDHHRVILAARNIEATHSLARDIEIRGKGPVEAVRFEALDMASHRAFYEALPHKPDIVLCVFGYLGDQNRAEQSFEEARRILDTNYTAAVSILEVVAADFAERREGCIIGISSVAGDRGRQSNYFYGSAKAGFTAYLSGLRNRLFSAQVHVMTVKPGFMRTAMTAHLTLPPLLTAMPERAAKSIFKASLRNRNVLYTPWMWRWIMAIIRSLPEWMFKRLKM